MVSVLAESIFSLIASLLKDNKWKLRDDESEDLGKAIVLYIETLPKNNGSKFTKSLIKYTPHINLFLVIYGIVGERLVKNDKILDSEILNEKKNDDPPSGETWDNFKGFE